jgi:hypothetical protein
MLEDDPFVAEFLIEPLTQLGVCLFQPHGLDRLGDHCAQTIGSDRLFEESESPLLHRLDRLGHGGMSCDHDHFAFREQPSAVVEHLHAVDVVHHQVGDQDIVGVLIESLLAFRSAGGHRAAITHSFQALGHRAGVGWVVVDDQQGIIFRICQIGRAGFVPFAHRLPPSAKRLRTERLFAEVSDRSVASER